MNDVFACNNISSQSCRLLTIEIILFFLQRIYILHDSPYAQALSVQWFWHTPSVCLTFFWDTITQRLTLPKIHTWCKESKILHLYEIILETCRIYLGLPETIDSKIHYNKNDCKTFITQLLEDGDVSQNNGSALVGSGSYEKINFLTYFKEGHLQMHVRFPKLGKCPLLWPILWLITLVCFLYNNRTIRNMSLAQTLRGFKQDNQKSKLLRIFDNTDHK